MRRVYLRVAGGGSLEERQWLWQNPAHDRSHQGRPGRRRHLHFRDLLHRRSAGTASLSRPPSSTGWRGGSPPSSRRRPSTSPSSSTSIMSTTPPPSPPA